MYNILKSEICRFCFKIQVRNQVLENKIKPKKKSPRVFEVFIHCLSPTVQSLFLLPSCTYRGRHPHRQPHWTLPLLMPLPFKSFWSPW